MEWPGSREEISPRQPTDEALVERCLKGDGEAWSALIHRYKRLIYSVPVKYGFTTEDANEVFQGVCLTMLHELGSLREVRALPSWLARTTARRCLRLRRRQSVELPLEDTNAGLETDRSARLDERVREAEEEQILRDAVASLRPDCRSLIELLFYHEPPLAYEDAAERLGLAKGSMGATRMRCLQRLRRALERRGLR